MFSKIIFWRLFWPKVNVLWNLKKIDLVSFMPISCSHNDNKIHTDRDIIFLYHFLGSGDLKNEILAANSTPYILRPRK